MKIKCMKRTVLMATAIFGLVGVLLSILETLGAEVFELMNKAASASGVLLAFLLIVLFALGGMCVWAFIIVYKGYRAQNVQMITLEGTKDNAIMIRKETLDEIIKTVIGQPDGITDVAITTQFKDLLLGVKVNLTVEMNANITSVTHDMQANIRKQLEEVNGIRLSGVDVIISAINVPEKTEGMVMPWAQKTEEETSEKAEEATEDAAEAAAEEATEDVTEAAAEEAQEKTSEENEENKENEENEENEENANESISDEQE